jgi:hypothetical protein
MGYINNTDFDYYEAGDLGGYQFVSLDDIISQFMVVYVGDEKIINNVSRTDVQFHAYRALAELSFDTLRSVKAQQIDVPPSLTMMLPKDYVNYTQISWVDSAGVKHPLYPTSDTSNPFEISQDADGSYDYNIDTSSEFKLNKKNTWVSSGFGQLGRNVGVNDFTEAEANNNDKLIIEQHPTRYLGFGSFVTYCYKIINVTDFTLIDLTATATTVAASTQEIISNATEGYPAGATTGTFNTPGTTIRVGLSTEQPSRNLRHDDRAPGSATTNKNADYYDIGYLEWSNGETGEKITETELDVTNVTGDVYLTIICIAPWTENNTNVISDQLKVFSEVSGISIATALPIGKLSSPNAFESSTWANYKANTPHENQTEDYEDDTYWPQQGERYGLEPTRAQINGSYYIDQRLGKINFSSNIAGKTVILDYISDSLGTDGEMQVHKFAEDAMYKWITYGVLASKLNVPEYIVQRAKKEKFASTRQAKLRLSNLKPKELIQILRGKSKQIKH